MLCSNLVRIGSQIWQSGTRAHGHRILAEIIRSRGQSNSTRLRSSQCSNHCDSMVHRNSNRVDRESDREDSSLVHIPTAAHCDRDQFWPSHAVRASFIIGHWCNSRTTGSDIHGHHINDLIVYDCRVEHHLNGFLPYVTLRNHGKKARKPSLLLLTEANYCNQGLTSIQGPVIVKYFVLAILVWYSMDVSWPASQSCWYMPAQRTTGIYSWLQSINEARSVTIDAVGELG